MATSAETCYEDTPITYPMQHTSQTVEKLTLCLKKKRVRWPIHSARFRKEMRVSYGAHNSVGRTVCDK